MNGRETGTAINDPQPQLPRNIEVKTYYGEHHDAVAIEDPKNTGRVAALGLYRLSNFSFSNITPGWYDAEHNIKVTKALASTLENETSLPNTQDPFAALSELIANATKTAHFPENMQGARNFLRSCNVAALTENGRLFVMAGRTPDSTREQQNGMTVVLLRKDKIYQLDDQITAHELTEFPGTRGAVVNLNQGDKVIIVDKRVFLNYYNRQMIGQSLAGLNNDEIADLLAQSYINLNRNHQSSMGEGPSMAIMTVNQGYQGAESDDLSEISDWDRYSLERSGLNDLFPEEKVKLAEWIEFTEKVPMANEEVRSLCYLINRIKPFVEAKTINEVRDLAERRLSEIVAGKTPEHFRDIYDPYLTKLEAYWRGAWTKKRGGYFDPENESSFRSRKVVGRDEQLDEGEWELSSKLRDLSNDKGLSTFLKRQWYRFRAQHYKDWRSGFENDAEMARRQRLSVQEMPLPEVQQWYKNFDKQIRDTSVRELYTTLVDNDGVPAETLPANIPEVTIGELLKFSGAEQDRNSEYRYDRISWFFKGGPDEIEAIKTVLN